MKNKKSSKSAKIFSQPRKQATLDNKTEKPLLVFYENRMLKNEKSANRNEHQHRKTEVFWH